MKSETVYRLELKKRLQRAFPDALVMLTDPSQLQGIPDLLILIGDRWAMLEVKKHEHARCRPNQEYYVEKYSNISFAAFVYPENERAVFDALQSTFGTVR